MENNTHFTRNEYVRIIVSVKKKRNLIFVIWVAQKLFVLQNNQLQFGTCAMRRFNSHISKMWQIWIRTKLNRVSKSTIKVMALNSLVLYEPHKLTQNHTRGKSIVWVKDRNMGEKPTTHIVNLNSDNKITKLTCVWAVRANTTTKNFAWHSSVAF